MTETTSAANKAKTTKHAASSFAMPDYGTPKFEMPNLGLPNTEMPAAFREMAEKGVEHTRDAYARDSLRLWAHADGTARSSFLHANRLNAELPQEGVSNGPAPNENAYKK